jgi:hypothetical protein
VLSYFAIDDVALGGPTSRCDVLSSTGAPIAELKGVEVLDDGAVTGFQLGIAAQPACLAYCSGVIRFLDRYCVEYGDYPKHARGAWSPSNPTEVAPSILRLLRDKDLSMNSAAHARETVPSAKPRRPLQTLTDFIRENFPLIGVAAIDGRAGDPPSITEKKISPQRTGETLSRNWIAAHLTAIQS